MFLGVTERVYHTKNINILEEYKLGKSRQLSVFTCHVLYKTLDVLDS